MILTKSSDNFVMQKSKKTGLIINMAEETKLPKKKGGPPPIVLDIEALSGLCKLGATQEEICDFLDISEEGLHAAVKRQCDVAFPDFYKKHFNKTKLSLRRTQLKLAQEGNVSLLIWLGKSLLHQSERHEVLQKGILAVSSIDKYELMTLINQAKDFKNKLKNNENAQTEID